MSKFVVAVALVAGFATATGAIAQSSSMSSQPSSSGAGSADQSSGSPAGHGASSSQPSESGQPSPGQPSPSDQAAPPGQRTTGQSGILVDANAIVGATVRSSDGKDIGKVERLMVDPKDGRVRTVVILQGGTLGIGGKSVSIPWESVKVAQDGGRIVVSTEQQMLDQAPAASPRTDQSKSGSSSSYDRSKSEPRK